MSHAKILIQLDCDPQPSVFDAVVAVDAGVDQLFRHGGVTPDQVQGLVHGAMFTRSPKHLENTAVFVGGSDVAAGERLLEQVQGAFFGPIRVSAMLDSNGCNTTAAAAVLVASKQIPLAGATALVLAATGPVGARVTRLLAAQGATVRAASRRLDRADKLCRSVAEQVEAADLHAVQVDTAESLAAAVAGAELVVCAGAAGVQLLPVAVRRQAAELKVAIDLNAVPPLGIEGIEATAAGVDDEGVMCFGAIGVGGTKMKIHHAAIQQLFASNDLVLDAEQIFEIARQIG